MTPDEAASRFGKLKDLINKELPLFIEQRIAHGAIVAIRDRVQFTGTDWRGRKFSPYSTRPILSSGTTEKSKRVGRALASSKKKRRQLEWRTIQHKGRNVRLFIVPGGYKQIRQLEGLQTGHKDFWFSTEMWTGFGVKRVKKGRREIVVTLGGRTAASQRKIDANSAREGVSIIGLSDSELKELGKTVEIELQKYIKKVGLS
jgi:hypothetical protein